MLFLFVLFSLNKFFKYLFLDTFLYIYIFFLHFYTFFIYFYFYNLFLYFNNLTICINNVNFSLSYFIIYFVEIISIYIIATIIIIITNYY
ncbi:hypothetical protein H8356DRAFT_1750282 [Neocallimastix lanati (nom. inval.)]|nr:hypothetical protein H8356DRAFT_1750282 [Neocallimastix sp. JGI-2020a]